MKEAFLSVIVLCAITACGGATRNATSTPVRVDSLLLWIRAPRVAQPGDSIPITFIVRNEGNREWAFDLPAVGPDFYVYDEAGSLVRWNFHAVAKTAAAITGILPPDDTLQFDWLWDGRRDARSALPEEGGRRETNVRGQGELVEPGVYHVLARLTADLAGNEVIATTESVAISVRE